MKFKIPSKRLRRIIVADAMMLMIIGVFAMATTKPEPVHAITVTGSTYGTVSLSWDKSDNAEGYKIYRSTDRKNYEYVSSTTETEFTDNDLRTGTTYYYLVSARDGLKQSEIKGKKAAEATPSLGTPELKVDTAKGEVKLSYTEVDGAIGYEIIRDGETVDQVTDTTYIDQSAQADKKHSYEVRAVRYKKEPVYSKASEKTEAELHSAPDFGMTLRDNSIHLDWEPSEHYDKYRLYNGTELLADTDSSEYTLENYELSKTYDLKLVGYNSDDEQSPEQEKRIQIVEEEMDNATAIQAAIDWGIDIANDDSFSYGTGKTAHKCGCYFCGTNVRIKGKKYEKTYCCNPFVHACFAHGAGDPQMLKTCQKGGSVGMKSGDYTRYGNWKNVGRLSTSELEVGDVLVRPDHVMLYIGDGQIVHAAKETWGPDGLKVGKLGGLYGKVRFVVRYTGNGSGTMHKIKFVDSEGNIIDDESGDSTPA